MTPVTETEEHKALRAAVAALGNRYGRDYITKVIADGPTPTNSGRRRPSSATSASTCRRHTAAEAAASPNSPSSWRSWAPQAAPS